MSDEIFSKTEMDRMRNSDDPVTKKWLATVDAIIRSRDHLASRCMRADNVIILLNQCWDATDEEAVKLGEIADKAFDDYIANRPS